MEPRTRRATPAGAADRATRPPLTVLVFVVGAASLGSEIAAARLLAPYFGASTTIWANTIAVVLLALSTGYWYGGKLADRHAERRHLSGLVLAAAIALAAVPFVAAPFLSAAVDALDATSAGAFFGSLVGVLLLVAGPVMLLGAVAPYAIRLSVTEVDKTGTTAGRLYAISTAGSLVGTFLAALLLIPLVGTQRTFLAFSLSLAMVAVLGLRRRWIVALVLLAGLIAIPPASKAAGPGEKVLWQRETTYQYARVVEEKATGERRLELNEGQAVHSLLRPGTYLTGDYWDGFLVAPRVALAKPAGRIAILGNAGGTVARAYGHYLPDTVIDAVEIDPALTEAGRRYFDMQAPHLSVHHADARPYLEDTGEHYDAIFIDAYRQPYIPFYLATREFFELCRDRLNPGGVVVINVGEPEGESRLEKALGRTLAEAFPTVLRDPVEPTNTLLIATAADGASGAALTSRAASIPGDLRPLVTENAKRIGPRLPGGELLTDDRAPVEWLTDRSIVEYAARGGH